MPANMLSAKNCPLHFVTIGICLSLFGVFCALYWELVIDRLTENILIIQPNSKFTQLWKNPPMLVKFDFYMFNWTNSEMYLNTSIKPKFEEIGPYSFLEVPEKFNIKWHMENSTVSYRRRSQYFFDAKSSKGNVNDTVITLNSLAVALTSKIKYLDYFQRLATDLALNIYHNNIAFHKTVDELLFNGFDDQMLNIAAKIPSAIRGVKVPFLKFGYFYPRNSSTYGYDYNVNTGADDIRKIGKVNYWNHYNVTDYYSPSCSKVKGSAGEMHPPNLRKHDPIEVFVPEFCRPVRLDFVEETIVEGIVGYKYKTGLRLIDNGTLYPENTCHCNGECLMSGVVNVTSCWFDLPLFLSYPHFYQADPWYAQQFDGIHPDRNVHEMYLVLEPKSSIVLDIDIRVQTNLYIDPFSSQKLFRSNRPIMFPLMWVHGYTKISSDLATEIKTIHSYIEYGQIFGITCFILSSIATVVFLIKYFWERQLKCGELESEKENFSHKNSAKQSCLCPESSVFIESRQPSTLYTNGNTNTAKPSLSSNDARCCTSNKSKTDFFNCT